MTNYRIACSSYTMDPGILGILPSLNGVVPLKYQKSEKKNYHSHSERKCHTRA